MSKKSDKERLREILVPAMKQLWSPLLEDIEKQINKGNKITSDLLKGKFESDGKIFQIKLEEAANKKWEIDQELRKLERARDDVRKKMAQYD